MTTKPLILLYVNGQRAELTPEAAGSIARLLSQLIVYAVTPDCFTIECSVPITFATRPETVTDTLPETAWRGGFR